MATNGDAAVAGGAVHRHTMPEPHGATGGRSGGHRGDRDRAGRGRRTRDRCLDRHGRRGSDAAGVGGHDLAPGHRRGLRCRRGSRTWTSRSAEFPATSLALTVNVLGPAAVVSIRAPGGDVADTTGHPGRDPLLAGVGGVDGLAQADQRTVSRRGDRDRRRDRVAGGQGHVGGHGCAVRRGLGGCARRAELGPSRRRHDRDGVGEAVIDRGGRELVPAVVAGEHRHRLPPAGERHDRPADGLTGVVVDGAADRRTVANRPRPPRCCTPRRRRRRMACCTAVPAQAGSSRSRSIRSSGSGRA